MIGCLETNPISPLSRTKQCRGHTYTDNGMCFKIYKETILFA